MSSRGTSCRLIASSEVLDWRSQQEADLLGVAPGDLPPEERDRLGGFIQYFERITRRMLTGGVRADVDIDPWIVGLGVGYRF